jgi:hypothetical protein
MKGMAIHGHDAAPRNFSSLPEGELLLAKPHFLLRSSRWTATLLPNHDLATASKPNVALSS